MTLPVDRYRAAGGVVVDGDRVLVLVKPARSEVRLPKGHVDPGETDEEAARREIAEETGYPDLEVVADLGSQRVAFDRADAARPRRVEREERFWLYRLASARTVPRAPEEAARFAPAWIPLAEAAATMTFEAERQWVRRAVAELGTG